MIFNTVHCSRKSSFGALKIKGIVKLYCTLCTTVLLLYEYELV